MKILYTTDLHGDINKFENISDIINDHELLILGADILPKGIGTTEKKIISFIDEYLRKFFFNINIPIIIDFGNDDWYMYYDIFKYTVKQFDHVYIAHMNNITIGDYTFIGMNYVPDYPFGIKDWCRREETKLCDKIQLGMPLTSHSGVVKIIPELEQYFLNQKSIREELDSLQKPNNKTVYIIHAPPMHSGLDVCSRVGAVGSIDVSNWIIKEKPLLTLHGHIHESFELTKIDKTKIGDTICINPGQKDDIFVWCEFNINDIDNTYRRKEM